MTRRSNIWKVAVALFILINVGGAVWAARMSEASHLSVHVGLLMLAGGIYLTRKVTRSSEHDDLLTRNPADETMKRLEESLDAVAVSVERIGEAQRFSAKVLQERAERDGKPEVA